MSLIGTRFYPAGTTPQNPTKPYCTYQLISSVHTSTMLHGDNLPARRIQIDCWSTSVDQARALAKAIQDLFHYYQRNDISGVQGVMLVDEREPGMEPETLLYRVSNDYMVHAERG
jgi:hypothetical protein